MPYGEGGELSTCAAMILMTLSYIARAARSDLLQPITVLAKMVTKWDQHCDRGLHRLMCYVYSTYDYELMSWIGDDPSELTCHTYADADFAGCPYTLRSTSGEHHNLQGPNSRFPWASATHTQTAVAQSTPEAEIASINGAMKQRGESALDIWQKVLRQYHPTGWKTVNRLHEDNTTCISCLRSGANKTM